MRLGRIARYGPRDDGRTRREREAAASEALRVARAVGLGLALGAALAWLAARRTTRSD